MVNCCLKSITVLHESLHWFMESRGVGADTLKSDMSQHLDGVSHEPLFQVFLDFRKAYDLLVRGRCLEIFSGYGLGLNLTHLLNNYWKRQSIIPNAGKFIGTEFGTGIVLTQGDSTSPIIFNIVAYAVVRSVLYVVCIP